MCSSRNWTRVSPTDRCSGPKPHTGRPRRSPFFPGLRQALEKFIWLGAAVGLDFSATELRSAFRVLALRYHPDRHPGIADVERARLGRIFAELSECHRQLVAVVAPIPH